MKIKFAQNQDLNNVAELSKMFASENCCNGIVADPKDYYLDKVIAIAIDDDQIVGYAYGNFEMAKKNKSYVNKDDKIFYLEEMYVVPSKRNLHLGEKLFNFLESYAKEQGAVVMELNAVSKNYLKLLNFYINKLNMSFLSAYLYKKI
ncbi:MAG: GNAT family N-acetyltransferase [Clostridia bacterium]|nr:GNAT family N-acetyltransferase [Clostridia bacterium]